MSVIQKVIGAMLRPMTRRRASGLELTEMVERLEESKRVVETRMAKAKDSSGNREAVNHIVGIERWGQNRLLVALGEPLLLDSYRKYRLPDAATLEELRTAFTQTRQRTIGIASDLAARGSGSTVTVRHNDLGDLTVTEWLVYLDDHAKRESMRIRP